MIDNCNDITFDAVICELARAEPVPVAVSVPPAALAALLAAGLTTGGCPTGSYAAAVQAYEAEPAPEAPRDTDEPPAPCERAVAAELEITNRLSVSQLHSLRREFAARNHPDRVAATDQRAAMLRMAIANHLIDVAIANARARAR